MKHLSKIVITICLTLLFTNTCIKAGEIHEAAAAGDLNKVKALLEADPSLLASKDQLGFTPLHSACYTKHVAVAYFLIDMGADVNVGDYFGHTPLIRACSVEDQDFKLIKRLIDKGADINAQGVNGITSLHMARNIEVAELLLDNGADINIYDNFNGDIQTSSINGTVLQVAINYRANDELAKFFVKNGANLNRKDSQGNTELHLAALKGYADLTQLLIKYGADINAINKFNRTALFYAAKHGYRSVAEELIKAGANKNTIVETNYGKAPQLSEKLNDGEAYLWYHGGYVIKTKKHLLIIDSEEVDNSSEAGLANGHLNLNELAGQKITGLITYPERWWPYFQEAFELAKKIPDIDSVIYPKPIDSNSDKLDIPSYRPTIPNESFSVNEIQVHSIPALAGGLGYLVETDGVKIFYAGLHISGNEASEIEKFRKEIDYLKPFGPTDIAILTVHSHNNSVGTAYEPYLYLLDHLAPKTVYLTGANIDEQYTKCAEVLSVRNINVAYPESNGAYGERFHYVQD